MNTPRTSSPRVVRDTGAILIESIWWDARSARLRWVDITAGTMHAARLDDHEGHDDEQVELPPPVSAFQPARGGGFVAALRDRVVRLDDTGAIVDTIAVLPGIADEVRLNEGKCDPFGSFVVGSMNLRDDDAVGALFRVRPDGRVEVLRTGLTVANGFEWGGPDGRTFYFTDTTRATVYAADYDPDGPLGDVRPHLVGRPSDGLALDLRGGFWNGLYGDGRVVHWNEDRLVDLEIEIPAPNVTSVAFGGSAMSTLFVGTARENLTERQLEDRPLSGALFAIDTSETGRAVGVFG